MISQSPPSLAERAGHGGMRLDARPRWSPAAPPLEAAALPGETLPTSLLSIDAAAMPGGANALAARMRGGSPPIVGRIEAERALLDPRTVPPHLDDALVRGVSRAL